MSIESQKIRIPEHLTLGQRRVLEMIAAGMTTKEQADMMGISVKSVDYHRAKLKRKTNLHCEAELTKLAIRLGLATVDV